MTTLTKRVQVLFPEELWLRLVRKADAQQRSVGSLIREAVEQVYFATPDEQRADRRRMVAELISMDLPVADWQQMESESTARGCWDE
ncbi:MAG: hypothetical protein DCC55_23195 [Chloroflexi bacterium]|nr:MAG: hypothetical protein DCC55_23195 [Chloroflexota bacterium]